MQRLTNAVWICLLLLSAVYANRSLVVSNVQARQRPGAMVVDITYDVFDADGDLLTVSVQISDDGGQTWRVPARTFRGGVGPGQTSGTGKHLEWDAGVDVPNTYGANCRPKVLADDGQGTGGGGKEITVPLPNGATMEMVWIEPGTFTMGTTEEQEQSLRNKGLWSDWYENEHPAHQVTISRGFYLGKHEITQAQWSAVMGTQPWSGQSYVQANPSNPAVYISWKDVQELVRKLNQAAGEEVCRLPTEAEWEYACRAGTNPLRSFGDEASQLGEYAWYDQNAWNVGLAYAQPVGTRKPNPWGLYDLHGNVLEWCQDWWYRVYTTEAQIDPTGPATGSDRVIRGGDFNDGARLTRSAIRYYDDPDYRSYLIGARLVRTQ